MLGRSHRFLGITSTFGSKYALLKDTTLFDPCGAQTPRHLDSESEALTTRPPRSPIFKRKNGNISTNGKQRKIINITCFIGELYFQIMLVFVVDSMRSLTQLKSLSILKGPEARTLYI